MTDCDHIRFFFNLRHGARYERDAHGLLLPDIDAAITAALYRRSRRKQSRRCEITDTSGKILAVVPAIGEPAETSFRINIL